MHLPPKQNMQSCLGRDSVMKARISMSIRIKERIEEVPMFCLKLEYTVTFRICWHFINLPQKNPCNLTSGLKLTETPTRARTDDSRISLNRLYHFWCFSSFRLISCSTSGKQKDLQKSFLPWITWNRFLSCPVLFEWRDPEKRFRGQRWKAGKLGGIFLVMKLFKTSWKTWSKHEVVKILRV